MTKGVNTHVAENADNQLYLEIVNPSNLVVKSNELVQKASYQLNNVEQKILLALIQQVRPTDDTLKPVAFTVSNFCKLIGANINGREYKNIKESIQSLADKSVWVKYQNKDGQVMETLFRWLEEPIINHKTNEIYLKLNDKLEGHLLHQTENFTQYSLQTVISMKSNYSIRLYEFLKSYEYVKKFSVKIDNLRKLLTEAKKARANQYLYPVFADFRRKVLDVAISEINEITDIKVNIEYLKTGRQVTDAVFTITKKTKPNEVIAGTRKINERLKKPTIKEFNNAYARQVSEEEYENAKTMLPKSSKKKDINEIEIDASYVQIINDTSK